MSQMPIGKYIYCTKIITSWESGKLAVTNAYRQVHLLYPGNWASHYPEKISSQMPIGKYIYCTKSKALVFHKGKLSQMPIGKYIYCTKRKEK